MTKKAATHTRPETAWDLMQEVHDAILASPTNYYQGNWACLTERLVNDTNQNYAEACGTAYCRAGWMQAILTNKAPKTTRQCELFSVKAMNNGRAVLEKAGVPNRDIEDLFAPWGARGTPGSEAYAKSGAAGVKKFMNTYAERLKAYKITDEGCQ